MGGFLINSIYLAWLASALAEDLPKEKTHPPYWTHGQTFCSGEMEESKGNGFYNTTKHSGWVNLVRQVEYGLTSSIVLRAPECAPLENGIAAEMSRQLQTFKEEVLPLVQASSCDEASKSTLEERAAQSKAAVARIEELEGFFENAIQRTDAAYQGLPPDPERTGNPRPRATCQNSPKIFWLSLNLAASFISCEALVTRNRLKYLIKGTEHGNQMAFACVDDKINLIPEPLEGKKAHFEGDRHLPNQSDITGIGTH